MRALEPLVGFGSLTWAGFYGVLVLLIVVVRGLSWGELSRCILLCVALAIANMLIELPTAVAAMLAAGYFLFAISFVGAN